MEVTLTTNHRGGLAMAKVEMRAIEKGWVASRPTIECRYDLVLDDVLRLYRAQVKYANGLAASGSDGAVAVRLSKWRLDGRRTLPYYTPNEIDLLLVYVPKTDQ